MRLFTFCLIMLFSPLFAAAQVLPLDTATEKVAITDTLRVAAGQKEIYKEAQKWVEKEITDKKLGELKEGSKKDGLLTGTGYRVYPVKTRDGINQVTMRYDFEITSTDSACVYRFTNITVQDFPSAKNTRPPVVGIEYINVMPERNEKQQAYIENAEKEFRELAYLLEQSLLQLMAEK